VQCIAGDWKEAFRVLASASQMFEVTAGSKQTHESHRYLQTYSEKEGGIDGNRR
jgi:hypothetical protein